MITKEELNKIKEKIFNDNINEEEKDIINEEINKEIDKILLNIQSGSDPIDE